MVVLNDVGLAMEIIGFALFIFVPLQETYNLELSGKSTGLRKIKDWIDEHNKTRYALRYVGIGLIIAGLIMQFSGLNTTL
jgi:hypothetical protein